MPVNCLQEETDTYFAGINEMLKLAPFFLPAEMLTILAGRRRLSSKLIFFPRLQASTKFKSQVMYISLYRIITIFSHYVVTNMSNFLNAFHPNSNLMAFLWNGKLTIKLYLIAMKYVVTVLIVLLFNSTETPLQIN